MAVVRIMSFALDITTTPKLGYSPRKRKEEHTMPNKPDDPRLCDLLQQEQSLTHGDVVLVFYPCDVGVKRNGGRAGASAGPAIFLQHFCRMGSLQNPEFRADLSQLELSYYIVPLDDLKLEDEEEEKVGDPLEQAHDRLTAAVTTVFESGGFPIVIGGGNDQSVANWRALCDNKASKKRRRKIGVINIDAHLDVRPKVKNGQWSHSGSPFRQILEESSSNENNDTATILYEFAAQGSQCSQQHANYVHQKGGTIYWFSQIRDCAASKFETILIMLQQSVDDIFVSFDLDSIRCCDCPGVSCPANTGLTAQDALDIMKIAGRFAFAADGGIVKMVDISELNPLVEDYVTPRLVVQMVYHFLLGYCGEQQRRRVAMAASPPPLLSHRHRIKYRLRISHLNQLVRVEDKSNQGFRVGKEMKDLEVIEDATILVDVQGVISYAGPAANAPKDIDSSQIETEIDGHGKAAIPGLCDAHTHSVWAGDRVHEFAMKLAGATYMDIHKLGGGINFTVRHTREADEESLYHTLVGRLKQMHATGTTLVECKSGYGLDTETELKMLRVIDRAQRRLSFIDVVGNFCGAHSIPEGSTEAQAVDTVVNEMIPALSLEQSGERLSSVKFIDVFAEAGVFSTESAEKVLSAGADIGLLGNFHGDELSYQACGELAGRLKHCRSVSHLEHVSEEGIVALKDSNTAAVLLPTTAFLLRIEPPPARKLIDGGVPVALGSDFNPNAHCSSMAHVMNLACITLNMSVEEALVASTLNAAYSMDKQKTHGSLEVGKKADIVVINSPRWEHIIYQFGGVPPLNAVIKDGVPTFLHTNDNLR